MKILVLSDSHGDISLMGKILENIHNQISLIIHLGDFFRDTFKLKN
ncbi:MAG: metallophosphoesterase family protein, partial [Clostridiales bacterium]|nr:metallophosphoesterase family protein [Clostridiales bacterium]